MTEREKRFAAVEILLREAVQPLASGALDKVAEVIGAGLREDMDAGEREARLYALQLLTDSRSGGRTNPRERQLCE